MQRSSSFLVLLALVLAATPALAQVQQQTATLDLPRVSPAASVGQRIGLTDINVTYHRPAVNERDVWGSLVPYGAVWRTGANENTLVSFSTDVKVEGQPLAAGTYGLHSIPGEDEWTLIFSNDTSAWGSFSYSEEQDALRVTVKPEPFPFHIERLMFAFGEVDDDSATLSLVWEQLSVPFKVEVDAHATALASMREQLKGVSQFFWMGPQQAANFCVQEEINYEEALAWINTSIQAEERFENLQTKAQLLEKTGEAEQSTEIMTKALAMGNGGQLHNYARSLIGQDKKAEALEIFKRNVQQNADAWFVELGLARGHSALGQFEQAVAQMKIAHGRAPEAQKAYVQSLVERLEKQEDIN